MRPIGVHQKGREHVRKKKKRQPLQGVGDLRVTQPHRRCANAHAKNDHVNMGIDSGEHLRRIGHSSEIGADVEDVCEQER